MQQNKEGDLMATDSIYLFGIRRKSINWGIRKTATYAALIVGSIIFSIPFLWMISTSLKEPADLFHYPPIWIPDPIQWQNYVAVYNMIPLLTFVKNTLIIVAFNLVGQLASSSLAAFGFARLRFAGRDTLFLLVLATMMLPGFVTMIPNFVLFKLFGWLNSNKPLIVPAFFGSAFYIFLLRQFFLSLPRELDEAAELDGCSPLDIYWRIILPLAKPVLATVAVFCFISNWNDFFGPLIYLNSLDKMTLALGLALIRTQFHTVQHLMMAASVMSVLPIIVIFFLAQNYFVQGIALTGRTGT
jgi:multiple sugar transport system permease protein